MGNRIRPGATTSVVSPFLPGRTKATLPSMASPLTIVVPVYNERRGLPPTVERLRAVLGNLPEGSEILLVDDGSTDGTTDLLRRLDAPGITVLRHVRNRGYGAALKTGIESANTEWIAIADADGTYPLERIPEFLRRADEGQLDMVIGARPLGQVPALRRPAKAVLRALAEYLTGEHIPDLNSGLRLFRREHPLRLRRLLPDGFSFTATITMALLSEGRAVEFVPIRYKTRVGRSKFHPITDTANFLMLICRTTLAFHPMKVFGPVGMGLVAAGLMLLVVRMVVAEPVALATTITLFVAGLQLLALGLLADLVNRRGV